MKNTGLLPTSINGKSYRNDQRKDKAIKAGERKRIETGSKTASTRISGRKVDKGYESWRASAEPDVRDALLQSQSCAS